MEHSMGRDKAARFFRWVTEYPKALLGMGILLMLSAAAFIPGLVKDTSSDSFIAKDNPARVYRDHVKQVFGLSDPFVIAVINHGPTGVFNPETLQLVQWLTDRVKTIPNVDPDGVVSLATENNIVGTDDGMQVSPFFEPPPATQAQANAIRTAIADFPLYQGSLAARDSTATLIVAEILDEMKNETTYNAFMALVKEAPQLSGVELHVAGEGAISSYLYNYIDRDATRLNPIVAIVITLVLFIAFRTVRGMLLPNLVVLATVAVAFGTMAASGVKFYVITNGLASILIGMAVAEPIHILTHYYEIGRAHPDLSHREIIVRTMTETWKPLANTILTTVVGFVSLYASGGMPPMQYFGLFAAIGVMTAWLYGMVFIPAALMLVKFKPSPAIRREQTTDRYGRAMVALGTCSIRHPRLILTVTLMIIIIGGMGASRLIIDEALIENFQQAEPIYYADKAINQVMDGTNYLDIVVETQTHEGLFNPDSLRRMEALQRFVETLPGVGGTTSVVDYIKQMHRSINENRKDAYSIPDNRDLVAQLFLLYSASGDPTDFEEEIDYDYRRANIRASINTSTYTNNRIVIEALEPYLATHFNTNDMTAHLSGRVTVNHHWLKTIATTHFVSEGLALVISWLMVAWLLRSFVAGLFTLVPVFASVLAVYGVMGFGGIWLAVGTSMFAAIATGLAIDFGVHTTQRIRELMESGTGTFEERMARFFPSTGRALFFNFAAMSLGFGTLMTSVVPPLIRFGGLVTLAMAVSFLASIMVMPAMAKLFRPRFLGFPTLSKEMGREAYLEPAYVVSTIEEKR
ncbi:MAG: RND family transporter [Nitrospira sp.]|nr:RND family transporter [Nitrospira sp.]MBH0181562.1 RND family transporter [Nitrospira sp.]MBH0184706.1 RND family transporter [Nitrospira sp.]